MIGRCRETFRKVINYPGGVKAIIRAPALRSRDIYQLCGVSSVPSPYSVLEDIALCNGTPGGELTCIQLQPKLHICHTRKSLKGPDPGGAEAVKKNCGILIPTPPTKVGFSSGVYSGLKA